jgi:hypothetical protein
LLDLRGPRPDDLLGGPLELVVGRILAGHLGHVDGHGVMTDHVSEEGAVVATRGSLGLSRRQRHHEERHGSDKGKHGGAPAASATGNPSRMRRRLPFDPAAGPVARYIPAW